MPDIFVSYRREDSSDVTGRICDHLKAAFGEEHLFKDVDSIQLGTDFREAINAAIQDCDVLLAVIGPEWLHIQDEAGGRRIDNPEDYVHLEIRSALDRNIPVIPVLVEGAKIPQQKELPEPLQRLAFRNAIFVRPDPDFRHDMERLCRDLSRFLKVADPGQRKESRQRRRFLIAMSAVFALVALVVLMAFLPRGRTIPPEVVNKMTVINVTVIVQEYKKYQGKPVSEELRQQIEQSVAIAMEGKHQESIKLLEKIAASAALPSIYTNLGVEYAKLDNVDAARSAFAKAIEKDPGYQAARGNQELLETIPTPAPTGKAAITFEPSPMPAILVDPLQSNPGSVKEIHVVNAGTALAGFYQAQYSLKPGNPVIVSPGNYDLVVSATEGGTFVLTKEIQVKEAQRVRVDPNVLLGAIMLEPLTRKGFPAMKGIRIVAAEAKGTRLILQQSEKLGALLPIVPGRYDVEGRTAHGDYCVMFKNIEVKAQQVVRIRTDEEVAGFVVRDPQLGAVQVRAIYVLKAGENAIIAETKKFGQPMLVPAGENYDIAIDQAGGRARIKSNVTARRGELLEVP